MTHLPAEHAIYRAAHWQIDAKCLCDERGHVDGVAIHHLAAMALSGRCSLRDM